jgi:hypothetical protein
LPAKKTNRPCQRNATHTIGMMHGIASHQNRPPISQEVRFPPSRLQVGTSGTNGDLFPTPRLLACVSGSTKAKIVFSQPLTTQRLTIIAFHSSDHKPRRQEGVSFLPSRKRREQAVAPQECGHLLYTDHVVIGRLGVLGSLTGQGSPRTASSRGQNFEPSAPVI